MMIGLMFADSFEYIQSNKGKAKIRQEYLLKILMIK